MQELINSLHVIQDECNKHVEHDCYECPMFCDEVGHCAVVDLEPYNWKINDHVQRALL